MSSERLPKSARPDTAEWYAAVRYGVAQELKKGFEPMDGVPQRFRALIVALQQAEQRPESNRRRSVPETVVGSEA
jgi:hypothetical protein